MALRNLPDGIVRDVMRGPLEGYVVEGDVPLAALEKLLTECPEVDGVSIPGMLTGVPGMPGPTYGPIEVISFDDGTTAPFLSL